VDVSVISVEVLDSLLLSESISVVSEDELLRFILKLGPNYRNLLRHIQLEFLSDDGLSLLDQDLGIPPESIWQSAAEWIAHPPSPFDSRIISDFPEIFAEFQRKQFSVLWRGSRDGFSASEFHGRCDDHGNTLIVILDTKGNIFGGFTPVKWESAMHQYKADSSLKSFLFTLKNPHNIQAKKFALKAKMKDNAIICSSEWGPRFHDMSVSNNCDTNTESYTYNFGNAYTNDTGVNRNTFFTGSTHFQVQEIEAIEITN
jgi:hypothetical protein